MAVNETMVSRKEVGDEMGEVLSLPLTHSDESTCLCACVGFPREENPSPLMSLVFCSSSFGSFFGLIVQRCEHSLLHL